MQWQYKSIGKEVKALEHNFTVACEALPACLEVLVTRYDVLTDVTHHMCLYPHTIVFSAYSSSLLSSRTSSRPVLKFKKKKITSLR